MKLYDQQRYLKPFVALVDTAAIGIIAFSFFWLNFSQLDLRFLLVFLFSVMIGARLIIHIPSIKGELTVSDTLIFLAMLLWGAEPAILLAAAVGLFSSLRITTRAASHLFNFAVMTCSTFLTVAVLRLAFGPVAMLGGRGLPLLAVTIMATVQYVSNSALVTFYTGLRTSQPFWPTWRKYYLWASLTYLVGASAALLIAKLIPVFGFYSTLTAVPVIAGVYITYKTYLKNVEVSVAQADQAKRHAKLLRESEERFRSAFDYAAIGMALVSEEGRWLQVNRSLCQLVGYSEEELLTVDIQALTHREDLGDLLLQQSRLMTGQIPGYQTEKRYIHKTGHEVWTLLSVSPVRDPETQSLRAVFQIQDITDRKRAEAQLVHDAFHDGLTGLPNRALFIDHLRLAVARSMRKEYALFSVLFLDLDRFKVVNDSLGHLVGDKLLMTMARRLESCLRPGDTIARLGGDEFTILLEDLKGNNEAIHVAERIQRELAKPFELDGRHLSTSASIGIAPSSTGYEQPEDILRDADTAMYYAKSVGGNCHQVFEKSMHTRAVKLMQMQADLRHAIENEELFVEYQPIVSLETFRVTGFEALARWCQKDHGLINPGQFIPLAEETGLIIPLGDWILREACAQTRAWQDQYPMDTPLTISVNLSCKQFVQPNLIETVERILRETDLNPTALKLEITESAMVENEEAARGMLRRLRMLGVGLSIDDFGTGYSSLSSLHRFPISTLKIDASFVRRMSGQNENTEIVRTIMSLADNLGMDVTAEGVETLEQVTKLRTFGCEKGQGFFFSRPVSAANAEVLLKDTTSLIPISQHYDNVETIEDRLVA